MASRGGALVVVLIVLCSLPVLPLQACDTKKTKPLVPAMFVFGDSLVDVGNNNHLLDVNNSCKANYPPYGVDYDHDQSPTGRFSNGHNLADKLAQQLGFDESPPPFLSLSNSTARRFSRLTSMGGINFASGGSGLLDTTGSRNVCGGQVISMGKQVGNFKSLVKTWKSKRGNRGRAAAADLISNSLVLISAGSNDLFEYSDFYADPKNEPTRNDTAFLQGLVSFYSTYVKEMYAAGATKFSIVSPSLVGCCPSQLKIAKETNDTDISGCFSSANILSMQLYDMISSMLQNLSQNELPGMKYSLGDAIGMAMFLLHHPTMPPNNFTTPDHACCGSGEFGEKGCDDSAKLCTDRRSYFFWDKYHPTEAVSEITAQQLFGGNGSYVHPVNVHQLVKSASTLPP